MSDLARALRRAAAQYLPPGAFLRRDRGEGMFVSDAPRLVPVEALSAHLAEAGFEAASVGGLIRLTPGPAWLARLEAAFPAPPDGLCAGLRRFSGLPPEPESLRLFALGAKALDAGDRDGDFERRLRQRAAVCLRLNAMQPEPEPRGGGLYACGLINHLLKEETIMKLKWLGHSCFELTLANGGVLVTDPYDDSVGYPPLKVRADAALSSHGHFDHNYFAAVEGDPKIVNAAGVTEVCGARITGVPSWHDDAQGAKRGENLIHVIEAEGLRVAHLGDLGHFPDTDEQRAALSNLDVMLIPIGGFFTIDTPTAVQIIETFKPRAAVAMHFKNRYCDFPVSDESEFVRLTGAKRVPNEIELTADSPTGCVVMEI